LPTQCFTDAILKDYLAALDFTERNAREIQIEVAEAESSSFDWIWTTGDGSPGFVEWLSSPENLFWISGKPASGKSTLMDFVSKDASTSAHLSSSGDRQWSIVRFFFDFRAGDSLSNNFEGFLRSLLIQLIEQLNPQKSTLSEFGYEVRELKSKLIGRPVQIRNLLQKVLRNHAKNVCLFIDGLDEFSGDMMKLISFIHGLLAPAKQSALTQRAQKDENLQQLGLVPTPPKLKICLASRPDPPLLAAFRQRPGFEMQHYNFNGIKVFVETFFLRASLGVVNDSHLHNLVASIADRAEGVFLWARFAVNEVITGYQRGDRLEKSENRLAKVPPGLDNVYDRILKALDPEERQQASAMFRLVAFAHGRVSVRTLLVATDLETLGRCDFPNAQVDEECHKFIKRIRAYTGGLLEITEDAERSSKHPDMFKKKRPAVDDDDTAPLCIVSISHKTVSTYLERLNWMIDPATAKPLNRIWLDICVSYLSAFYKADGDCHKDALTKTNILQNHCAQNFLEYALLKIVVYARLYEDENATSALPILRIILVPDFFNTHMSLGLSDHSCKMCRALWKYQQDFQDPMEDTALSFTARHGISLSCKELLDQEKLDRNSTKHEDNVEQGEEDRTSRIDGDSEANESRALWKESGSTFSITGSVSPESPLRYLCAPLLNALVFASGEELASPQDKHVGSNLVQYMLQTSGTFVRSAHCVYAIFHNSASLLRALLAHNDSTISTYNWSFLCRSRWASAHISSLVLGKVGTGYDEELPYGQWIGPLLVLAEADHAVDAESKIDLLIGRGEDINASFELAGTALDAAARSFKSRNSQQTAYIMEMLLIRGANPNSRPWYDSYGPERPLAFVWDAKETQDFQKARHVILVLLHYGALASKPGLKRADGNPSWAVSRPGAPSSPPQVPTSTIRGLDDKSVDLWPEPEAEAASDDLSLIQDLSVPTIKPVTRSFSVNDVNTHRRGKEMASRYPARQVMYKWCYSTMLDPHERQFSAHELLPSGLRTRAAAQRMQTTA
jgi:hypothetical protein